jgi:hypothetical protein
MKRMYVSIYRYRDGLDEDDLRDLTKKFMEIGTGEGVVGHYERLDGRGGFLVQESEADPEQNFENTIRYNPWIDMEIFPVTTMEDAFPVIQRVYG